MCNQPREALLTYHRLNNEGQTPNSTTFNTLISAYGKLGQVDNALEVYQEMIRQNMERSVITYSSLISACEKGDQWETALNIFGEMRQEGCAPNTVTFNSLITACAQGGQCEKAREVFDQMAAASCAPDVVTYTALITAYERGGDWQRPRPPASHFSSQAKALAMFMPPTAPRHEAQHIRTRRILVEKGIDALPPILAIVTDVGKGSREQGNCIVKDAVAAMMVRILVEKGIDALAPILAIVTDVGKGSREQGNCIVKDAVAAMMVFWDAPFKPYHADDTHTSVLESSAEDLADWLLSDAYMAQLASLFPISEAANNKSSAEDLADWLLSDAYMTQLASLFPISEAADNKSSAEDLADWLLSDAYMAQLASLFPISEAANIKVGSFRKRPKRFCRKPGEERVLPDCSEAFAAVEQFESTHGLVLPNMSPAFIQQRPTLISRLLDISSRLGLRDEVVHDAVLLMDRTASQAKQNPKTVLKMTRSTTTLPSPPHLGIKNSPRAPPL
eukprot:gene16767-23042_t